MSVRQRPAAPHAVAVAAAAGGERRLRAVLQAGRAHAAIGHPCGSNDTWTPPSEFGPFHKALRKLYWNSLSEHNDRYTLAANAETVLEEYAYLKQKKEENWFEDATGPKWLEHPWRTWLLDIKARADKEEERFEQVMNILAELMNKV